MAREGICASFHKFFHIMFQASVKQLKAGMSSSLKKSMKDEKPNICHCKNH